MCTYITDSYFRKMTCTIYSLNCLSSFIICFNLPQLPCIILHCCKLDCDGRSKDKYYVVTIPIILMGSCRVLAQTLILIKWLSDKKDYEKEVCKSANNIIITKVCGNR